MPEGVRSKQPIDESLRKFISRCRYCWDKSSTSSESWDIKFDPSCNIPMLFHRIETSGSRTHKSFETAGLKRSQIKAVNSKTEKFLEGINDGERSCWARHDWARIRGKRKWKPSLKPWNLWLTTFESCKQSRRRVNWYIPGWLEKGLVRRKREK